METVAISSRLRNGFTVIELIFVIIIIGILAAMAISRLAVTRDDAKLSADVSNMAICIRDAAYAYTAQHIDFTETDHSDACDRVVCYTIVYAVNGEDFNVTTNSAAADYCADIDYVGGNLAKSYHFGGQKITR